MTCNMVLGGQTLNPKPYSKGLGFGVWGLGFRSEPY